MSTGLAPMRLLRADPAPVVVALGGHLLASERGVSLRDALAPLGRETLVLTHGNGPQVGEELLRNPGTPIHVAVARTQADIGAPLAAELGAACVITHVRVAADDRAFAEPTKPIGPSYAHEDARALAREHGWVVKQDGHRGWRRVVPSPEPVEVVEVEAVRALVAAGVTVVACGGGGIPVVRRGGELVGVDAVIDKDRASALLAAQLGARRLIVLTDVPAVYRGFRSASEQALTRLSPAAADAVLPGLPAGSMRPKLEACATFVRATGGEALVTSADALADALAGRAGTRVAND